MGGFYCEYGTGRKRPGKGAPDWLVTVPAACDCRRVYCTVSVGDWGNTRRNRDDHVVPSFCGQRLPKKPHQVYGKSLNFFGDASSAPLSIAVKRILRARPAAPTQFLFAG